MTDTENETGSVTVRMASSGVSDPELLSQVYELETDSREAKIEAERAKLEAQQEQSLAQTAVKNLVESLDPEDLVPLVRLLIEAFVKAQTGLETDPKTKTKLSDGNVSDSSNSPESGSDSGTSPVREKLKNLDQ